jgi:hypothetical protein
MECLGKKNIFYHTTFISQWTEGAIRASVDAYLDSAPGGQIKTWDVNSFAYSIMETVWMDIK